MSHNILSQEHSFDNIEIHRVLDHTLKLTLPSRRLASLDYTIIYFFSGTGYLHIRDKIISVRSGDYFVVNPMVEYYIQQDSPEYLHYLIIELNIYPQKYPLKYSRLGYIDVKGHRQLYMKIFEAILANIKSIDPVPDYLLAYLIKAILLLSHWAYIDPDEAYLKISSHPEILKCKRYIDNNYTETISLETLAELVNLSPSYLSRKFHHEINESPRQYWLNKRLEHAEKLIKNTQIPLKIIAKQVGFNNYSHFSNLYKNKYGLSPRNSRKDDSNNN